MFDRCVEMLCVAAVGIVLAFGLVWEFTEAALIEAGPTQVSRVTKVTR